MCAKVGHEDLIDKATPSNDEETPDKTETTTDKEGKEIISKETKKKMIKLGKKVSKTTIKVAGKIADSGVLEQVEQGQCDGCIASIPGGPYICCICKLLLTVWKAKRTHDKQKKIEEKVIDGVSENIEHAIEGVAGGSDSDSSSSSDSDISIPGAKYLSRFCGLIRGKAEFEETLKKKKKKKKKKKRSKDEITEATQEAANATKVLQETL